jgi:hypothetical protein
MRNSSKHSTLLGLASVLVLFIVLSSANPAHAQPSDLATVIVTEHLQPLYDVYGGNSNQITVDVNGSSASVNSGNSFTIITFFKPSLNSQVGATEVGVPVAQSGGIYTTNFTLITGTTSFNVSLAGSEDGASFLWRYLAGAPFVTVTGLSIIPPQFLVSVPSGNILTQIYTAKGQTLPLSSVLVTSGPGQVIYSVPQQAGLLIFQSSEFLPASIAITVAALVIVALAALNLFAQGRQLFDTIFRPLRTLIRKLIGVLGFIGSAKGFRIRSLLEPRKLLALFILCALLMVALGALGGPDPRLKAYVVADGSSATTNQIKGQLAQIDPNLLVLTPSQDYTDFNVMSSVGQFNVVVFSDYSTAQMQEEGPFILGNLGNVPVIVMDSRSNATINASIETLYPDQVLHVQNASALSPSEQIQLTLLLSLNQRTNILGLNISNGEFKILLEVEAVLSMLLVFVGWAYLGSMTSESRAMTDLSHLVLLVGAGVFVFFFSETIYVVTSSILAVPISLHAVNSDAHDVTAIGLLGFGGGSTPRLAAGFIGVLLGAVGAEGGLRFRKSDFALIAGVMLILLANPLYIGQYVYQGILLLFPIGNYAFGAAFSSSLSLKGFIYGFGSALGGDVSQVYILSAGKILFFAGLIPLAYMKKMGRTTTVVALLLVALMIGDGGVRVGEMTPDKTVIAVVPGLVAGFAFAAVILALAAVEKYVRGNWKSRG